MASVDIHLDWLRWTVDRGTERRDDEILRCAVPDYSCFRLTGEQASIGQGYNQGRKLQAGMLFWHTEHREQGISVQLSGIDLQTVRDGYATEQALLMAIQAKSARITTLHSCINVHDAGASPTSVLEAKENGSLETRARQIGTYSSETKGHGQWFRGDTVYIGSPKSAVQIRIYNKAAEQKIIGDWTRIEIVFRGKYAQMAFESMCKYGIASVTRAAIQKQMNFSAAWWVYAMRGGIAPPMQVKRKERGTITWLKNAVMPALEREIKSERAANSDEIYELFAGFIDRLKP